MANVIPGLKLIVFCPLCRKRISSISSGVCKSSDTVESIIDEMMNDVLVAHLKQSPECLATEDDLIAESCDRVTN